VPAPHESTAPRPVTAVVVFLALLAATTLVIFLPGLPGGALSCSPAGPPPASDSPVKHVFFLIKENHAFENYFGALPGVIGYPPNGSFPAAFGSNTTVQPFPIDAGLTPDLPHDRGSLLVDLNGGLNDQFVAEAAAEGYANPADAVGYYTSTQLPDYYAYAHYYSLDDMFFPGVLGPTLPNRLFDLGLTGMTWSSDSPPPSSALDGPTLPGEFGAAGLPWDYFYSGSAANLPPLFVPQISNNQCLITHVVPMGDLPSAIDGSNPPAFAFIDPEHDPLYSEHPPSNVTQGEDWTAAVVNTIFQSPIGNSSAIFLFYDEGGGFWDPIAPPSEAPLGDGFRVPLLVLSPWTPSGQILHQILDPAALIAWTGQNWGLAPLTPRIASAPPLVGFFNFSAPARGPLLLPTPVALSPGPASPRGAFVAAGVHPPVGTLSQSSTRPISTGPGLLSYEIAVRSPVTAPLSAAPALACPTRTLVLESRAKTHSNTRAHDRLRARVCKRG
jgi:phospholipase C